MSNTLFNTNSITEHIGASTPVETVNTIKVTKKKVVPSSELMLPEKAAPMPKIIYKINSATKAIIATKNIIMAVPNFIISIKQGIPYLKISFIVF